MKFMSKIVVLFSALILMFCSNVAFAADFSASTKQPVLVAALNKLEAMNNTKVVNVIRGQNSTNRPIKVMFRNLEVMGYGTCEAVTAKTADGQTATCEVTSKAWELVVYDNQVANGSPLTPEDVHWGDALAFGPHSDDGKIIEDWRTSGFVWKHNCLDTYSDNNVYVIADVLYSGQIGEEWGIIDNYSPYYISITYGEYEDKMIIPDLDF